MRLTGIVLRDRCSAHHHDPPYPGARHRLQDAVHGP